MEYIYAALLLHSAGKEISEENLRKVVEAAGIKVDEAMIKVLVSSLKGVNIDEVLKSAPIFAQAPVPPAQAEGAKEKKEEKKKEEKPSEEEAAAGLAALFG